jgi:hypothetical protein
MCKSRCPDLGREYPFLHRELEQLFRFDRGSIGHGEVVSEATAICKREALCDVQLDRK